MFCFVCFVSLWEFQTCFFSLRIHESGVKSPRFFLRQAMFAVATGLSMKDMQGVFQAHLVNLGETHV